MISQSVDSVSYSASNFGDSAHTVACHVATDLRDPTDDKADGVATRQGDCRRDSHPAAEVNSLVWQQAHY
jgi:hypothetical protein